MQSGNSPNLSDAQRAELARYASEGRLIEAVRLVRDEGGLDGEEAEAYVRGFAEANSARAAVRASVGGLPAADSALGPLPPDVAARIDDALRANRLIAGIKEYRDATGASLADAKHIVERRRDQLDLGRSPGPAQVGTRPASGSGIVLYLVAFVILLGAAIFIYRAFSGI